MSVWHFRVRVPNELRKCACKTIYISSIKKETNQLAPISSTISVRGLMRCADVQMPEGSSFRVGNTDTTGALSEQFFEEGEGGLRGAAKKFTNGMLSQ